MIYIVNTCNIYTDLQITFLLSIFVTLNVTSMNTRLKQFIAAENITQAQFADTINVVRASVSHILAGRNKPSYEFICGLMRHYPNLNIEWLMFGKGKMYKDSSVQPADLFGEMTEPTVPVMDQLEEVISIPETISPVQESHIPAPQYTHPSNGVTLNDIKTLVNEVQKPVNQRKLIKITAFFDDGTFQELSAI